MKPKKLLSFILATAMAISLLPTFTLTASATTTTTAKKITLGTSALSGYDSTNGYKYVYYGTYENSPIKWRILSMNGNDGTYYESTPYTPTQAPTAPEDGKIYTDSDETTKFIYLAKSDEYYKQTTSTPMFLLSEYALKQMAYELAWNTNDGDGQTNPSDWRYSDAWYWCNDTTDSTSFIRSSFTASEKAYFLKTSKANSFTQTYTDELKGDTFFFLSYAEASQLTNRVAYMMSNPSGNAAVWWLSSPDYNNFVYCVYEDGNIHHDSVGNATPAARPAFNLNLSSVLFTSAANGGKSSTAAVGGGAEISKNADYTISDDEKYEYKLTMKDDSRNFEVAEKSASGTKGETITLDYENAETGSNEYISAMIVNNNDEVLYYGQLANITNSTEESGTVDFVIPSDIDYGTYELRLFNEQINGDYKTDYSSGFSTVELSVEKPKATFTTEPKPNILTYNGKEQELVTAGETSEGTVKYSFEENGTYTTNIPTYKNATTDYTVWYYIEGDSTHSDSDKASVKVTISQKEITTKNATITLAEGLTYNGTEQTQTISKVEVDGLTLTENDYTVSDNKGTEAKDDYILTISGIGNFMGRATEQFAIAKATASLTTPTTNAITYGVALSTVALPNGWAWANDDTVPTVINSGYTAYYTLADTSNYDWTAVDGWNASEKRVERTVAVTVNKANSSVTTAPKKAENLVYTGDELTLLTMDGTAEGGTIKYSDDGTNFDYDFANIPKVKNADDYRIWYKVIGDENHNDTAAVCIEIKVAEKQINTTITLTAPVKNATPQTSIETDEYTATVVWSPTVDTNGTFAKSTEYTATITVTPKANYTVSGIAENGYTLDGATSVTNDANSNVVTAAFPKTAGSSGGGSSVTRYTVKFDTDGGSTIANQTVTKNSKATEPTKPTKEGYIFDGWYSDSELTTEYDFDTKVTKNITLYAKWSEDEIQEPSDDKKDDEPQTDEWKNPFTDVTKADWFFDNVRYANENGLMSGTTATTFAPNDSLTRAMLVTVLWRAEGEPNVDFAMPFTDVADTAYYAEAVRWAASENIVNGITETEFAPDMNITREQIAAIIYRYAKYKGYDVSVGEDTNILSYADFDEISEYAIEAVQYAVGSGLMKGKTETTLNPKDNATRAEIAAILNRFIEGNK